MLQILGFPNRQFNIISQIGQGGEGTIYKVEALNWKKEFPNQFAIKTFPICSNNEKNIVTKIMTYQQQNELYDSNKQTSSLVKIYDIFEWNSEQVFVMEIGQNNLGLFQRIRNCHLSKKQKQCSNYLNQFNFPKRVEINSQRYQTIKLYLSWRLIQTY